MDSQTSAIWWIGPELYNDATEPHGGGGRMDHGAGGVGKYSACPQRSSTTLTSLMISEGVEG